MLEVIEPRTGKSDFLIRLHMKQAPFTYVDGLLELLTAALGLMLVSQETLQQEIETKAQRRSKRMKARVLPKRTRHYAGRLLYTTTTETKSGRGQPDASACSWEDEEDANNTEGEVDWNAKTLSRIPATTV